MDPIGVIYILTNPSFPDYVKIGYADDVNKRLKSLNSSEAIPFAFRLFAYYKVNKRLTDLKLHSMIDKLNPNLRSVENYKGKTRTREFYAMPAEQAYKILETIAEINDLQDNLVLVQPTDEEIKSEEEAKEIKSGPIDKEKYLENKDSNMVALYDTFFTTIKRAIPQIKETATRNYIALRNHIGRNICEVHLYKTKILLITKEPKRSNLRIGSKVPDSYLWSLNYRIYFATKEEINQVVEILLDVNNQIINEKNR